MLARRGVNPRLVGLEGRVGTASRYGIASSSAARHLAFPTRTFTTTTSSSSSRAPTSLARRLPSIISRGSVFSSTSSSSSISSSVSAAIIIRHERRCYATETVEEGATAAAEAATHTGAAVERGSDAMASFIAAADPVTSLTPAALEVVERTTSSFPPINWLVDAMTFVHYAVPLSWAATAVCFTLAFRTMILPAVALTMQNSAKMRAVQPELEKIKAKYGPNVGKDVNVAMQYREEVRKMMAQSGVSMWKTMVPFLVQTPLFVSFFFTTRKLAEEEPGLRDASFLFFNDLSAADPYYIMPILTSLTMLATIELGSDGVGGQSNPALKNFLRLFSVLAIPATSSLPIFTHIYWFSSNLFSLCQLGLFKVPFIKKALGLPDYQGVSPMLASSDPQPTKPEATFQQKPRIIRTKSQK